MGVSEITAYYAHKYIVECVYTVYTARDLCLGKIQWRWSWLIWLRFSGGGADLSKGFCKGQDTIHSINDNYGPKQGIYAFHIWKINIIKKWKRQSS